MSKIEYDVAFSFAGEDRAYVDQVASHLQRKGLRVFYDKYEQVSLWGKDLYEHLQDVYQNKSQYTVMFISKYYANKLWTKHERKILQAKAFEETREYILPARFDDTEIPGLSRTIAYVDLNNVSPKDFSELVHEKVSGSHDEPEQLEEQILRIRRGLDAHNFRWELDKYLYASDKILENHPASNEAKSLRGEIEYAINTGRYKDNESSGNYKAASPKPLYVATIIAFSAAVTLWILVIKGPEPPPNGGKSIPDTMEYFSGQWQGEVTSNFITYKVALGLVEKDFVLDETSPFSQCSYRLDVLNKDGDSVTFNAALVPAAQELCVDNNRVTISKTDSSHIDFRIQDSVGVASATGKLYRSEP